MKFTALEEYGLRCILHLARRDSSRKPDPAAKRGAPSGSPEEAPPARSVKGGRRGAKGSKRGLGESVTLGEVAEREGLTQQYAGKIFRILAKAGLVESERGRKGGYRLTRRPGDVTVSEVLTALGGKFFDRRICGRYTGDRDSCVHSGNCSIRLVWMDVQRVVDQVLTKLTLTDLVLREARMTEARDPEAFGSLPGDLRLIEDAVSVGGTPCLQQLSSGDS